MTTKMNRPGAQPFVALENAIEIVAGLRDVVAMIRKHDADLARQIFRSASSIGANVAEGNGRKDKDRLHHFRIAAGSAQETRAHLRIAVAWSLIRAEEVSASMALIDRQLRLLWGLTH